MKKVLVIALTAALLYSMRMFLVANEATGDAGKVKALLGTVITEADLHAWAQENYRQESPRAEGAQQTVKSLKAPLVSRTSEQGSQSNYAQTLAVLKALALTKKNRDDAREFLILISKIERELIDLAMRDPDINALPTKAELLAKEEYFASLEAPTKMELDRYQVLFNEIQAALAMSEKAKKEQDPQQKDMLYEKASELLHQIGFELKSFYSKIKNTELKEKVEDLMNKVEVAMQSVLSEIYTFSD